MNYFYRQKDSHKKYKKDNECIILMLKLELKLQGTIAIFNICKFISS